MMRFLAKVLARCAGVLLLAGSAWSQAATVDAVEFYNTSLKHYFLAVDQQDISKYDHTTGWVRTGMGFKVWPAADDAMPGAVASCQYGAPLLGPDIRLYSVSAAECDFLSTFSLAVFEQTSFYALPPENGNCAPGTQPVYRGFRNINGDINFRFVTLLASYQDANDRGWSANDVVMCVPGVSSANKSDIVRLLAQSTFGPNDALIAAAQSSGIPAFVDRQFNAPKSSYPDFPYVPALAPDTCKFDGAKPATDPVNICARDTYSLFQVQLRFLQNALSGEDQLRQRVAFALSQILVVSGVEINQAYAMARYQQLLLDGAFGNFRDLLYKVTLSPAMGRYLDMVNNDKPDPVRGTEPNENYAREVLQLFSIGLYRLNQDGTQQRDAQGRPIASYDQDVIEGFAHAFTGWTYPPLAGAVSRFRNPPNFSGDMVAFANNHDTQPKLLLNGKMLPAGQGASKDLNDAIDNIFNHPNVGPFIGRQLIQKLVTGTPGTGYVARVAAVFNDNGSGVRGDLKAVVRAILLDAEARGEIKSASSYGHLQEPVRFVTGILRGLSGSSDGVYPRSQLGGLGQNVFNSPTVFNYYSPEYALPASGTVAPEFDILNSSTVFSRANFINNMVFSNGIAADASVQGATGTRLDLSALQALAADPAGLVDKLSWTYAHGSLSTSVQRSIIDAVTAIPASDTLGRARAAAYLVLTSSQAQVER